MDDPIDLPEGTQTIVKVQKPTVPHGTWLVFAQGLKHSRMYKVEQLPVLVVEAMGDRRKRYFNAEISRGEWWFRSLAGDQSW